MGLSENLTEIKNEIESLTEYANGVTGVNDVRLGNAVRTLADGFGQGGGGVEEIATLYPTKVNQYGELKIPQLDDGIYHVVQKNNDIVSTNGNRLLTDLIIFVDKSHDVQTAVCRSYGYSPSFSGYVKGSQYYLDNDDGSTTFVGASAQRLSIDGIFYKLYKAY